MELRKEKFLMNSKHKRKNGGKLLTNKALTHEGHTPSNSIKTKQTKEGKENG